MTNVLFSIVTLIPELITNNMLKNVTKLEKIEQFCRFTCFYIHVDSECVGELTYAG